MPSKSFNRYDMKKMYYHKIKKELNKKEFIMSKTHNLKGKIPFEMSLKNKLMIPDRMLYIAKISMCDNCGRAAYYTCSVCKKANYCSQSCQVQGVH